MYLVLFIHKCIQNYAATLCICICYIFVNFSEALFGNYGYQGAMLLLAAISLECFVCAALFRPMDLHKKISKTQRINE